MAITSPFFNGSPLTAIVRSIPRSQLFKGNEGTLSDLGKQFSRQSPSRARGIFGTIRKNIKVAPFTGRPSDDPTKQILRNRQTGETVITSSRFKFKSVEEFKSLLAQFQADPKRDAKNRIIPTKASRIFGGFAGQHSLIPGFRVRPQALSIKSERKEFSGSKSGTRNIRAGLVRRQSLLGG